MLRDTEKQTLTRGMYVRFILRTDEDLVPALVMLSGTNNVYHVEQTEDGHLLFVFFLTLADNNQPFQAILDLQNDISSLFPDDKAYTLDFVTSNPGEYDFHVFGHIGEGQVANLFLPAETIRDYDKNPEALPEKDKELAAAYRFVYRSVVENI